MFLTFTCPYVSYFYTVSLTFPESFLKVLNFPSFPIKKYPAQTTLLNKTEDLSGYLLLLLRYLIIVYSQ